MVAPVIKSASADFAITFAISDDQENNVVLSFPIMPSNDTLVTTSLSETLTNKTLTTPVIAQVKPDGSATLTMPTATDTLVGKATTDTLTNKTMGDSLAMGTNKVTGLGDPTAAPRRSNKKLFKFYHRNHLRISIHLFFLCNPRNKY